MPIVTWGEGQAERLAVLAAALALLLLLAAVMPLWLSLRGETGAVVALPLGILLLVISVAGRDRPVPDLSNEEI